MAVIIAILYTFYLPDAQFLWLPQQVAQVLREEGATHRGDVIMIDYREDSLPYYSNRAILAAEENYFSTHDVTQWPRWVVISSNALERHPNNLYQPVAKLRGLVYARRGTIMEVVIMRRRDSFDQFKNGG